MVFPVVGGDGKPTGYEIDNSLRFNDGDSPKLQITTGSNSARDRFTFSAWVKKAQDTGDDQTLFSANDGGHQPHIRFDNTSEQLNVRISNSASYNVKTNRSFRDSSAWYHIVVAMNTQESTDSNRIKIYVNGVQETSLATADYPTQNYNSAFNANTELTLGRDISNDDNPFDGYMAEVYYVDGIQYAASDFGEYNNNGVWVPKDAKDDINFGTHGFYFEFKQTGTGTNSSGMGADTSGNDNHYAVSNLAATDVTTDTPTNNFCTLNPLDSGTVTFAEGNCEITCANDQNDGARGSIGVQNGKWYFEFKLVSHAGGNPPQALGVAQANASVTTWVSPNNYVAYEIDSGKKRVDGSQTNYGATATDDDIIGVALNMDDNEVTFYKNGSSQGTITSATSSGEFYFPYIIDGSTVRGHTTQVNFGNPPFAISSGNADGNGYGNFEYSVPSGYYSLCTKNLAEFG